MSTHHTLRLADLIQSVPALQAKTPGWEAAFGDKTVIGVTNDSRQAKPGVIFVALSGSHANGHDYLPQAMANGALAVIIDDAFTGAVKTEQCAVFSHPDTWQALALLSGGLYSHPGEKMKMIGVTGTNGKTTVTHLIQRILEDQSVKTGLIGTLGVRAAKNKAYNDTGHTTPMAHELQEILADLRDDGHDTVVMEVSSHALSQHRVLGCDFDVAVLTNVTQDHLDYHLTMSHYWQAKSLLFSGLHAKAGKTPTAIINLDSDYAAEIMERIPDGVKCWTYAIRDSQADIRIENPVYSITGSTFTLMTPVGQSPVSLKLGGQFSVYNALAAIACALAIHIPLEDCIRSISAVEGIPGRFEVVAKNPSVIVDYAHTPDGLENVLKAARVVTPEYARLITVFGCGGDRDATKRPKMGRIAEQLSDVLVITSDNPRSEDPQPIITDIISGIQRFDASRMIVNADREQAIHSAIDMAKPNDIIVIAGKGHETYQILADRTIDFDDKQVVQEYISSLTQPVN